MEKGGFGEIMVETLSKLNKDVNFQIEDAYLDTFLIEKL